jgi:hypothetical protein
MAKRLRREKINPLEVDTFEKLFHKAFELVHQTKKPSTAQIDAALAKVARRLDPLTNKLARAFYRSLQRRLPTMVEDQKRDEARFAARHYRLWKSGFDLLEAMIVTAMELGSTFNNHHRPLAAKNKDFKFEALTRLHARSVHVAREIQALLRAGFADGAHARWRTTHEIAVVSVLINAGDQSLAERYLHHEVIESYKAALQYQEHADALGQPKISDVDIAALKAGRDGLCAQYGKDYAAQYGWAAALLKSPQPTFDALEKLSGLSHLRPYYRMASHNVHANPKGATFKLGLSRGSQILLAGPSNYGLTDPAQCTALSLATSSVALMTHRTNLDTIVHGKVLDLFADAVAKAFWKTQRRMETAEARA